MLPSCLKQDPKFDLVYILPGEKFEETLEKSFREHRLMRFFRRSDLFMPSLSQRRMFIFANRKFDQ
ncbi:MAG: hypothetical protein CMO61_12735 [Verrucomicrobiales bacterium]|nr:hypothetical protein [Verrucomicrobiales bacterium]